MLGRLTAMGCAQRHSREICRQVLMTSNCYHHDHANVAAVRDRSWPDLKKTAWLTSNSPAFRPVPQRFASKATAKLGKKVKKETFDRYLGLDPSRLQDGFEEIPELKDASEDVRKIFSLEFASGREIKRVQQADTLDAMETDPNEWGFSNFLVTCIARLTVTIRNLAPHVERFPRDKKNKRLLLMSIDHRRKLIKALRRTDFELAGRLLAKLGLEFTPDPLHRHRQTKRALQKKTLCQQAFSERMRALEEFTGRLREEQLREIAELKRELGMELTEEETGRLA